ncbi:hypothetical protein ACP275_05G125000 [Erythranthe tilingii]
MTNPFKKQTILMNNTQTPLLCESRLSAGVAGVTYSGIASYSLPANSHKVIPYDVFTKESVYLLKSLQIHATAAGMNPKILDIGEIEENEAIIFFALTDRSIGTRFIPRDENERGLAYYLRGLTTFWRRGDDFAALLDLHV